MIFAVIVLCLYVLLIIGLGVWAACCGPKDWGD